MFLCIDNLALYFLDQIDPEEFSRPEARDNKYTEIKQDIIDLQNNFVASIIQLYPLLHGPSTIDLDDYLDFHKSIINGVSFSVGSIDDLQQIVSQYGMCVKYDIYLPPPLIIDVESCSYLAVCEDNLRGFLEDNLSGILTEDNITLYALNTDVISDLNQRTNNEYPPINLKGMYSELFWDSVKTRIRM